MNKNTFLEKWHQKFEKLPLVSHTFKDLAQENFVRIHSLPESKQYPENIVDIEELLKRQNLLISDLIGDNNDYYLVVADFVGNLKKTQKKLLVEKYSNYLDIASFELFFEVDLVQALPEYYELNIDGSSLGLTLAVAEKKWEKNSIDQLLIAVAEDIFDNLLIISKEKKIILAPYDGGIDVVLENKKSVKNFLEKYQDWLPLEGLPYNKKEIQKRIA